MTFVVHFPGETLIILFIVCNSSFVNICMYVFVSTHWVEVANIVSGSTIRAYFQVFNFIAKNLGIPT